MLKLASETRPEWAQAAVACLDEILLDHAHCERKAAGAAIRLMFAYPEHRFLQEPLSRLAREELVHFEAVLGCMHERGVAFGRQRPSPYGGRLHASVRAKEPGRLVDLLLIAALIEARSCERFKCLAEVVPDPGLAAFYRGLLASEARHHGSYLELAAQAAGNDDDWQDRLAELAVREAEILCEPVRLARLHA